MGGHIIYRGRATRGFWRALRHQYITHTQRPGRDACGEPFFFRAGVRTPFSACVGFLGILFLIWLWCTRDGVKKIHFYSTYGAATSGMMEDGARVRHSGVRDHM